MSTKEVRALPVTLEVRQAGDNGSRTITGSILYNTESKVMRDIWGDAFVEELTAGCFDESLKTRNVVGLWSHDVSQVLGNTKAGTLRLESNEERLAFELDLPDTQAGRDAYESVKRGDVDGVSFGMIVTKDKWTTEKRDDETVYKRTVLEAELWEISPVAFPAFPANEVQCRSLEKFKEEFKMSKETEPKETKKETLEEIIKKVEEEVENMSENRSIPAVAINSGDNKLEQRAAFNHYLRTGEIREGSALMTVGNTGAIAPVDFAKEIIDGLADVAVMRQIARILPPISGKSAAYPRRTGGSGAAMVSEGQAITPYELTFDQVTLTPHKAAALVEVSNELLQDEAVDLAGYLAQHFRDEIGELIEGQYWNGNGTAPNLQGILTAVDDEGEPLIKRIETKGASVTADDVLALWAALPAKYRKNAVFVCNSAMEAVLRKLKDADGRYLMVQDLATGLGNTLLGRPLVLAESFPGDIEAGKDVLMVGDFKRGIYIADKAGIDIQRNDSIGFNKDTVAFRAIFRTDIAIAWPDAMRILQIKASE
ncbi:MAG: phage major capsid protein [Peptococcaceae bacterium MAG4]|nr:phage major capsid protein [Peptococcaceae bacterium MAG4]